MTTEAEMKTKWYPWARSAQVWHEAQSGTNQGPVAVRAVGFGSINRGTNFNDPCLCLGSGCALWKWKETYKGDNPFTSEMIVSDTEGYCGIGR